MNLFGTLIIFTGVKNKIKMKPEEYEKRASDLRTLARNMTMKEVQRIINVDRGKLIRLTEHYQLRWESREKKRIMRILEETVDPVLKEHFSSVLKEQRSYGDAFKDNRIRKHLYQHKKIMRLHRFADSLIA